MKFKSSLKIGDYTSVVIEDSVLSRRFVFEPSNQVVYESVFLKKPVGRPIKIASWYHRGDEASRICSVLDRYELQSHVGGSREPRAIRRL